MRVPIGVAILGFFALLAGLADVLLGLNLIGWVTFGPARTGSGVALTGILALVTGAIYIAVAAAAWSMRPWAWAFGMIMAGVGLFEAFLVMLGTESVATGLGAAILPGIVLFYLNTQGVKRAFITADEEFRAYGGSEAAERMAIERSDPMNH